MTTSTTIATSNGKPCPFCTLPDGRIVEENEFAVLIRDGYPVFPGHSLVIPKRHVGFFFEVTAAERAALMALLESFDCTKLVGPSLRRSCH